MRKLALVALLGFAATCTPTTPKYVIKYAEKRGTIEKNGLRFVVVPDSTTQMVEVDIRYDVGSREDPPGKAGLAHLVEHLMFQQRPDGPTSPPLMHFLGQMTSYFNAFTEWDKTHYNEYSRIEMLDDLLKIEAMRMYYRCQTISEPEFEREREVVRNEIRWRGNGTDGQIQQMVLSSVYPKGHAYERDVGGNDAQIASISLKDACDFMDKYYTPDRAVLVVAGGIDVDATLKSIEKWFGGIEKRTPAPRVPVEPVTITGGRAQFDVDIERPQVWIAWALPPSNTPEGEAAQFGIWSAFFDTAFQAEKWHFATKVQPQFLGGQLAPVFAITMELKDIGRADEAIQFALDAAKQAHRGFDQGDYEALTEEKSRRKAAFIADIEQLPQRTLAIAEAVQFSKEVDFGSSDEYVIHELAKIDSYDGAAVRDATKRALDPDHAKIIIFRANKQGVEGDTRANIKFQTQADGQKEVPEVDPREALKPLKVAAQIKTLEGAQRFTLDNGLEVVMLKVDSLPLVAAGLVFHVGSSNDPAVAENAMDMLHGPMDAEANRVAGISVRCRSGLDTSSCFTHGINIYLDVMLKSLERQINSGDYSQEAIEERQREYRDEMKLHETQLEFEVRRQTLTALYGADHPYTKAQLVTTGLFDTLGHDKLESFNHDHFKAANATLIIAGNFDVDKAQGLVRSVFGGWSKGSRDAAVPGALRPRTGPEYIGVASEKDKPQTNIVIMYPGPAGVDGQEAAREVLAEMLNERMGDVRFKLGSSYGTYAGFRPNVGPSAYQMGGAIDTPRMGESLKAMRAGVAILQHVAAGTGTDEEKNQFLIDFVRARRKLIQDLLGQSTVSLELAQRLAFIAAMKLPPDYYNQLLQRTAAMSPAQVMALIASELKPENEIIVTRGTRDTIEKTFTEAGIANVKIVEPEYK